MPKKQCLFTEVTKWVLYTEELHTELEASSIPFMLFRDLIGLDLRERIHEIRYRLM